MATTESRLNQVIKGAPPPSTKLPTPAPLPPLAPSLRTHDSSSSTTNDATSLLPSSPPQIYLNLLILESSLRAQYLQLLGRRRINTFFLLLLVLWNSTLIYLLFLRPREDGHGFGGSVYWFIETSERVALLGGIFAGWLVWATGQFERGYRWPRRWLGVTNRGLRGFNLRVVRERGKWWQEMYEYIKVWEVAGREEWHWVEHEDGSVIEEDLSPGGGYVMVLLAPKNFSAEFRQEWEEYRRGYWDKENVRREGLLSRLRVARRIKAKELGGWQWWSGVWRWFPNHVHHAGHRKTKGDLERFPHGHHGRSGTGSNRNSLSLSEKDALKATRRSRVVGGENHSRQSSRSSTPQRGFEVDGAADEKRSRRGSSVSSTGSRRGKLTRDKSGLALTVFEDASAPRRERTARPSKLKKEHEKLEKEAAREDDASDLSSLPNTPMLAPMEEKDAQEA